MATNSEFIPILLIEACIKPGVNVDEILESRSPLCSTTNYISGVSILDEVLPYE